MNLSSKKRIVAELLDVGVDRIWFDADKAEDIKSAITRDDLRNLIKEGVIKIKQKKGVSRVRARYIAKQKAKGRRKGTGARRGKPTSRLPSKEAWMAKIRSLRKFFSELSEKKIITQKTYRDLRKKAKSGIFRNKRHVKLYLEDNSLFVKKK